MKQRYLLTTARAEALYDICRTLPIYDYHCHLSPKEIWEDKEFTDIADMWLGGDHYKWQLMRAAGIEERYITGSADGREKFRAYAETIEFSAGNPLYHWTEMELALYFDIDTPLNSQTADEIYDQANRVIRERHYSPRRLIEMSRVAYIGTTDDPADDLPYHEKLRTIREEFPTVVAPSFRTDNLLLVRREGYLDYLTRFGKAAGIEITDLASLDAAIEQRLAYFCHLGCRFSDIGIPFFPHREGSDADAEAVLGQVLRGEAVTDEAYSAFLYRMYRFLGGLYRKYHVVMQWHLAVHRNANSRLFAALGGDCGGDTIGDAISGRAIIAMLDAIEKDGGLPRTILYTLNPIMNEQLATITKAFPRARLGTAWWFNDHKDGIADMIRVIARNGHIGSFLGMLTDSRSFLSYARHDYFRRILCSVLAEWEESGEYSGNTVKLAEKICCENIKTLIGDKLWK